MKVWIYQGLDDWVDEDDVYATLDAAVRGLGLTDVKVTEHENGLRSVDVGSAATLAEFEVTE